MRLIAAVRWAVMVTYAVLLVSCGGGDSATPAAVSPLPPATPAAPPAVLAAPTSAGSAKDALAYFEAASVHAYMAGQPIYSARGEPSTLAQTTGPCFQGGSVQVALDGVPPSPATVLPSGGHTFAITYSNCVVDALVGVTLTGGASVAYATGADWNEGTARFTATSLRGYGSLGYAAYASMSDVTASGSGTLTWKETSSGSSTSYLPEPGATLVNNLTGNVITFEGGSASSAGQLGSYSQSFSKLAITVNGDPYVLDGTLTVTTASGLPTGGSGEVLITRGGTVVGHIYVGAGGRIQGEGFVELSRF